MTKRAEMNIKLANLERMWRRGEISYKEYSERTKQMIKDRYNEEERESERLRNELHKDKEPAGLLGIALRVIRKIFH